MCKSFWDRPLLVLATVFGIDAVLAAGIVIAVQTASPRSRAVTEADRSVVRDAANAMKASGFFASHVSASDLEQLISRLHAADGSVFLITSRANFTRVNCTIREASNMADRLDRPSLRSDPQVREVAAQPFLSRLDDPSKAMYDEGVMFVLYSRSGDESISSLASSMRLAFSPPIKGHFSILKW